MNHMLWTVKSMIHDMCGTVYSVSGEWERWYFSFLFYYLVPKSCLNFLLVFYFSLCVTLHCCNGLATSFWCWNLVAQLLRFCYLWKQVRLPVTTLLLYGHNPVAKCFPCLTQLIIIVTQWLDDTFQKLFYVWIVNSTFYPCPVQSVTVYS